MPPETPLQVLDCVSISPNCLWVVIHCNNSFCAQRLDLPESLVYLPPEYEKFHTSHVYPVLWRFKTPSSAFIQFSYTELFEWDLEQNTLQQLPRISGAAVALTSDDTLLSVFDFKSLSVKVWCLSDYRVIHEVRFTDDPTMLTPSRVINPAGAISPGGDRLYNSSRCNHVCDVWELDAVIQSDESGTDDNSLHNVEPSMEGYECLKMVSEMRQPNAIIMSIAFDRSGSWFVSADDLGDVFVHDINKPQNLIRCPVQTIIDVRGQFLPLLTWSLGDRYLALVDHEYRVTVCSADQSTISGEPELQITLDSSFALVYPIPEELTYSRLFGPRVHWGNVVLVQLLFHPSEELIFLSYLGDMGVEYEVARNPYVVTGCVWSLKSGNRVCTSTVVAEAKGGKWVQHPTDSSILLFVGGCTIRAYKWDSLVEIDISTGDTVDGPEHDCTKPRVLDIDRVVMANGQHVLVEGWFTGDEGQRDINENWMIVDFEHPKKRIWFAKNIARLSKHILGCYKGKIVFLDHNDCLCTWNPLDGDSSLKRHLYLPRDWQDWDGLVPCCVNEQGTVLYPRNGEVGVIQNGIKL